MSDEIKQDVVLKTQKYLGKHIKKPPLTEKLLKKPPFRFLHDVIKEVIKETGFLKGLFTDAELNSDNVKEREPKIAFLTKLIDAVKTITKTELTAKPSKIVAGLEPTETNLLLQAIGKAIDKKLSSSEYVTQLNSGAIVSDKKKDKKQIDKNKKNKTEGVKKSSEKIITNETPKSTDRDKTKSKKPSTKTKNEPNEEKSKPKEKSKKKVPSTTNKSEKTVTPTTEAPPIPEVTEIQSQVITDLSNKNNEGTNLTLTQEPSNEAIELESSMGSDPNKDNTRADSDTPIKRNTSASRPKSARPKSGDLKNNIKQDNKDVGVLENRPKTSLRPPSVRPSSARPGAPRLRPDSALPMKEIVQMGKINVIVENFDKDDDEETVIIQNNAEIIEDQVDDIKIPDNNKGHLVEQILEQLQENDDGKNEVNSKTEWNKSNVYGKDTAKETNNLRNLIQTLTKTANPLGKLLNYLHEDIDAMYVELESWTHTKRQLFDEIAKQKKISAEMNKPLIHQLENLNEDIQKIQGEIAAARNNIFQNEAKIKKLIPN